MATPHPRLPRNTRTKSVRLGYAIEEAVKLDLERYAAAGGVSAAVFVELMVKNLPLNDEGLPVWMNNERLPINPD
ncbi:hypothetical protein [Cryobacterium sp. Y29]|jgi:hypothetical protein|uniref:hypothetical protein n=1 Tax=Cryobacterium sp. Y29 TaxID=2048285 RepID=UPI000CE461E1|nr:hypothetical protein [Cryobacterium sp. Y29]